MAVSNNMTGTNAAIDIARAAKGKEKVGLRAGHGPSLDHVRLRKVAGVGVICQLACERESEFS